MAQYYGESQWPGQGPAVPPQGTWDHQTPPPQRSSGANSVVPREESAAFSHQIEALSTPYLLNCSSTNQLDYFRLVIPIMMNYEADGYISEVDRALDNLYKSGKMFVAPGRHGRVASGHHGPRHSVEFVDSRAGHPGPNLQNFYAAQRHQSSRGSNEAEQMMQAKRRMAAQRERELRNYHQEQQYNRNTVVDVTYNGKPERALSPGSLSEGERRELIQRQRSALYGDGHYEDAGANRQGATGLSTTSSQRGPSPLAFDYGRPAPVTEGASQPSDSQVLSRANSNTSPKSNAPTNIGAMRTSNSSPTGGSPPRGGASSRSGQSGGLVAPIGTRPSISSQTPLTKLSTTPLPSPLSHGVSAPGSGDEGGRMTSASGTPGNPASAAVDGYNGWGGRSAAWNNKSSLSVQASVWG
ncbi:hypothetical protein GGR50DRAFT_693220 [Xylaria sp. CBS 124048]|nr:hypothetical protein GGR50DRAFT_693220 [Xylaria sp. CBS 124048]